MLEQRGELSQEGAAIALWRNALTALDAIGVSVAPCPLMRVRRVSETALEPEPSKQNELKTILTHQMEANRAQQAQPIQLHPCSDREARVCVGDGDRARW